MFTLVACCIWHTTIHENTMFFLTTKHFLCMHCNCVCILECSDHISTCLAYIVFFQISKFCRIHENNQWQLSRKSSQWLWTNNEHIHSIKPSMCSHQAAFSCLPVTVGSCRSVLQIAITNGIRNGSTYEDISPVVYPPPCPFVMKCRAF